LIYILLNLLNVNEGKLLKRIFFLIANFWEIILNWIFLRKVLKLNRGSWSYGSWIYNYLCNQCRSPLKLRVRIPFMARCTRYAML
jgi:hypothetical protein